MTENGVFTWTPSCSQGGTTNLIVINATDSGSPTQNASITFKIIVAHCLDLDLDTATVEAGQRPLIPISLTTSVPVSDLSFVIRQDTEPLSNWAINSTNLAISSATMVPVDQTRLRIQFKSKPGQTVSETGILGVISADTPADRSLLVWLVPENLGVTTSDGSAIPVRRTVAGAIAGIASKPLVLLTLDTNSNLQLRLFGRAGTYNLLTSTNLSDPNGWKLRNDVTLTNISDFRTSGRATNATEFFKIAPN